MSWDLAALHNFRSEGGRFAFRLSLVAVLVGLALRSWQYLADPSLFIDEIALARNIKDLSWPALLFSTLDYEQLAPPGFLALLKLAITALGPGDMAFRLIPYLSSIAGMLVFYLVAARLPGLSGPAALILFAISPGLIETSLLVKPYGCDIFISLLLIWQAMKLLKGSAGKAAWPVLAVLGLVSVWVSYPAAFTLWALALSLAVNHFRDQKNQIKLPLLFVILAAWLINTLAAIAFSQSLMEPHALVFFKDHWSQGLAPWDQGVLNFLLWPAKRIYGMYLMMSSGGTERLVAAFYLAAGTIGAFLIWAWRPRLALLLYLQITLALFAALGGYYPFLGRVALFLLPSFIILAALSLEGLNRLLAKERTWLPTLLTLVFLAPSMYSYAKNPVVYRTEEMKPLLAYVQECCLAGDRIYVYYGAAQAMMLYGPRFGFEPGDYQVGGCHRGDTRSYFKELDRYRGAPRLWVIICHTGERFKEKPAILSYLSTIGHLKKSKALPGCSAHLFDLSDEARLRAARAASHQFQAGAEADLAWGCGQGPQANYLPRPR